MADNSNNVVVDDDRQDREMHYDLDDDQVEALVSAIEASPVTSGGETSEVAIRAALFLTGDRPSDREQDFIDALVQVQDVASLEKELDAFDNILADFTASTEGETAPQVLQTKERLGRIVSLLQQSIQYANPKPPPPPKSLRTAAAFGKRTKPLAAAPAVANDDKNGPAEKSCSVFDTNWFRFAAFSIVAVLLLLAIVAVVQWLRAKYETDEQQKLAKEKEAELQQKKVSDSVMI